MMADLKKKYGQLEALKHIDEYKKNWKQELARLVQVLKFVVQK